MTTTLANARIELSKQLGDYWSSAATSAGAAGGTTIVDTALAAKNSDWIDSNSAEMYDLILSGTYANEERRISSLSSSTLTTLAHGGQIASAVTYEIHRLFSASDKRTALIAACRSVFPQCYTEVWNEEMVSGNWLKDGSFERWTTSTNPTDWTDTTVTATQTTTVGYFKHGATSCRLNTAAGTLKQSISNHDDLKFLQGRAVTFSIQGWCDTASCLRIAIYDGTTRTYSEYHPGDSAWTQHNPRNDNMYVTAQIGYNPTEITLEIYHAVAAGTSYVDDARVISEPRGRLYIGHLGLYRNTPNQVLVEPEYYSQDEDWIQVRGWKVDNAGYLYLPTDILSDYRLRIRGMGTLDFTASGVSSTAWTATVPLDQPQLDILVADAIVYLCRQMITTTHSTGNTQEWKENLSYWEQKSYERKNRYRMAGLPVVLQER